MRQLLVLAALLFAALLVTQTSLAAAASYRACCLGDDCKLGHCLGGACQLCATQAGPASSAVQMDAPADEDTVSERVATGHPTPCARIWTPPD